ncbi:MAG: hypothetical protein AAF648_03215 [Pseudomonadota bacterium]
MTGIEYVEAAAAQTMPGLRLALTVGVPGPWGQAAMFAFDYKGIPYTPVAQYAGEDNADLVAWTGIRNAPIAVFNDEAPRSNALDIVALAERITATPGLIPKEAAERQRCFGISWDICGEGGFGWTRRITMSQPLPPELQALADTPDDGVPPLSNRDNMARAYRPAEAEVRAAEDRLCAMLDSFAATLTAQAKRGSPYFVGESPTLCDLQWAAFTAVLEPLPHADNPMPNWLRARYMYLGDRVAKHKHTILLEHRDHMFAQHLSLPLRF